MGVTLGLLAKPKEIKEVCLFATVQTQRSKPRILRLWTLYWRTSPTHFTCIQLLVVYRSTLEYLEELYISSAEKGPLVSWFRSAFACLQMRVCACVLRKAKTGGYVPPVPYGRSVTDKAYHSATNLLTTKYLWMWILLEYTKPKVHSFHH